MIAAPVDEPLLWPSGYHALPPGLSCVDCGRDWPCPPYQAMMRRVHGSDTTALVEFMRSLLPAGNRAGLHLSAGQVQERLVGWCTKPVPEAVAPQAVAGRPLPQPRRVPPPPHRRPATPIHTNAAPPGVLCALRRPPVRQPTAGQEAAR